MAKYIKHNSNYIKTVRHQFLKDGSTIFERDWVTVGSQLNFGPGKIPYYNDGNFIFTTSPIPFYQKKYKNGVTVGMWTYEDVKDALDTVNKISLDEHTEDIRSYVYYGSCLELVRVSIENIIKTFPGNITVSDEELGVFKNVENFVCNAEDVEEVYVPIGCSVDSTDCEQTYWTLNNPFDINVYLKDVQLAPYDNPLHYLTLSFDKYQISQNNGSSFTDITDYVVVMRKMYEKTADPCIETIKEYKTSASLERGETQTLSLESGEYFVVLNDEKMYGWEDTCYTEGERTVFTITEDASGINFVEEDGSVKLILSDREQTICNSSDTSINISFYKKVEIEHVYMYYQMFDDEEYENTYKSQGWVKSTCVMNFWLPDSVFLNRCDYYRENPYVLYSEISRIGHNQPVYTVTINESILIEGYIFNGEVIPLVTNKELIIQPKDEVIEEYFNSLKGFEKQLLTRKTKPLYLNRFVTPIEYNLGYLYYKRTYIWPSNGYCIDITSPRYIDFVNSLTNMAQLFDELWTDNLWRRMTHEAIKNYDWTYTREFEDGEEQDNVDGGERMHKVLNIIARVFDDIKRTIDTIKRNNRVTYDADRNIPNALLSDKLELRGWDIYSTIPNYIVEDGFLPSESVIEEETISSFTDNDNGYVWYPTLNPSMMTFADVDNQFMCKLLLSTRTIFETKGTRQGIDMIMGMFGYGNMDEENPEYELTEEYYVVSPREYDEAVGEDELGDTESLGDRIVRLNTLAKQKQLLYDEDASGIPVGSFAIFNNQQPTTYLIPFYNQNKIYDGDLYFQTNGGWFYNGEYSSGDDVDAFKWTETLSYLHVASQVKDLLNVNPNSVGNGDIYYVANVNDYIEFTEEPLYSNFFVLEDEFNPEKFSSWTNLNLEDGWYDETTIGYTDDEIKQYKYYVKKAKYLDSIIPYTAGNNPHVGYGKYDMGNEYLEYMKLPFKYSIEEDIFDLTQHKEEAEDINFTFGNDGKAILDNEKVRIIENGTKTKLIGDYGGIKDLEFNQYKLDDIKQKLIEEYYINCKVIHFKNNIASDNYKLYFRNVIMKYLMQLIPSTTIFVLENFELESEKEKPDDKITVIWRYSNGDSYRERVERGTEISQRDGKDWTLVPQGDKIENWPYTVNEQTIFYEYIVITHIVHFKYADGTEIIQEVEDGGYASESQGKLWSVQGSTDIVDLTQYRIYQDTWFVEVVTYTVTFYDTNATTVIRAHDRLRSGDTVNKPDTGRYYYKGNKSNEASFPYTVTNKNEEFVKYIFYTVKFIDNGTTIDTQSVRDGLTAQNPGGLWSLQSDGGGSTVNISSYIIEHDTTFYRWVEPIVYYTVRFVDKNGTQIEQPQQVAEGDTATNPRSGSSWHKSDESETTIFNFNTPITADTTLVLIEEHTVNWLDDGSVIESDKRNVIFYDVDGQTEINREQVNYADTIDAYDNYDYYKLGDSTKTKVNFPYIVLENVSFVKRVEHTVKFYENENDQNPTVQKVIEPGTVTLVGNWYRLEDPNKTPITGTVTITKDENFVKVVEISYIVNWYESE